MSGPDDKKRKDDDVGYCRPPVASRFQPGRSGNPTGRRKKPDTIADQLRRALERRVSIEENGRRRKISAQELIFRGLVHDAAVKRDPKAIRTLLALMERYGKSDATMIATGDLAADDQRIIDDFVASLAPPAASPKDH